LPFSFVPVPQAVSQRDCLEKEARCLPVCVVKCLHLQQRVFCVPAAQWPSSLTFSGVHLQRLWYSIGERNMASAQDFGGTLLTVRECNILSVHSHRSFLDNETPCRRMDMSISGGHSKTGSPSLQAFKFCRCLPHIPRSSARTTGWTPVAEETAVGAGKQGFAREKRC